MPVTNPRLRAVPALAAAVSIAVIAPLAPAYGGDGKGKGDQQTFSAPGESPAKGKGKPKDNGKNKPKRPPRNDSHDHAHEDEVLEGTYLGALISTDADHSAKPTAAPVTAFQMPFPCGEVWTGTTRSSHSPSVRSVDFNASNDLGRSVVATAGGVVTTAVTGKNRPSYGQFVVIEHGNDESTLYAHLDSVLVTVGDQVSIGSPIGTVGNTGNSSGAHLHFEMRRGSSVIDAWFDGARFPLGTAQESRNCNAVAIPDIPLAGNAIGGKKAELVTFRREGRPAFRILRPGKPDKVIKYGEAHNQPLLGDWNGNGKVSPGVRDPSTKTFMLKQRRKVIKIKFGSRKHLALAGDWDGDGVWDVGVRTPNRNRFKLRLADGSVTKMRLGDANDIPVVGDWDGDGDSDLGVFDQETATFTLQKVDASGMFWLDEVQFGEPGDLPLAADWDGNGVTDLGVWDPETATYRLRQADSPASKRAKVRTVEFGQSR